MKAKKQILALVTLAMFVFFLASPGVRTQEQESSASLKETMDWITSTLQANGYINDKKKVETSVLISVSSSGCTLKYDQNIVNNQLAKSYKYEFSLSDLDPVGIEIQENSTDSPEWASVTLHTSKNASKVNVVRIDDMDHKNDKSFTATIAILRISLIRDKTMAKRLKRAFEHAIKLCGGKVDPF
jgi:hypothetical protein